LGHSVPLEYIQPSTRLHGAINQKTKMWYLHTSQIFKILYISR
jgi:hypothetical protein